MDIGSPPEAAPLLNYTILLPTVAPYYLEYELPNNTLYPEFYRTMPNTVVQTACSTGTNQFHLPLDAHADSISRIVVDGEEVDFI